MTNLDLIQMRYPNRLRLTLSEACQLLGISAATARNKMCKGNFGVKTRKDKGRNYVHVTDLAEYLDTPEKKRGARTKAERIEARIGQ